MDKKGDVHGRAVVPLIDAFNSPQGDMALSRPDLKIWSKAQLAAKKKPLPAGLSESWRNS